ncbi:hypothetical protein G7Z17_g11907 [Cylindrodendrum hubeiense]|uniref:Uncharacterized protein n=1 Tax=Cylindrodendrum hubeiense TaxID=595255 RepID=A0A9P5GYM9_9HYPO|nr:hypothetical protein G7Z17_g11907 [Cylindrodendrum hubeiense]
MSNQDYYQNPEPGRLSPAPPARKQTPAPTPAPAPAPAPAPPAAPLRLRHRTLDARFPTLMLARRPITHRKPFQRTQS